MLEKINFIQIGAHTGDTESDIFKTILKDNPAWVGIFVEPIQQSFNILKQTYASKNCFFENVAIMNYDGQVKMYVKDPPDGWDYQNASIDRKHWSNRLNKSIEIPCKRLNTIVEEYNMAGKAFDFLQIDAEGADGLIILNTDFDKVCPEYIRFEHIFLSQKTRNDISTLLLSKGYRWTKDIWNEIRPSKEHDIDTVYVKKEKL